MGQGDLEVGPVTLDLTTPPVDPAHATLHSPDPICQDKLAFATQAAVEAVTFRTECRTEWLNRPEAFTSAVLNAWNEW